MTAAFPSRKRTRPSLLRRVRDTGDHRAWAEFLRSYDDLILRYCSLRGLQLADAEDVRQIVTMRLARALQSFEYDPEKGRFRSYLGRTVENAIRRHRARARRSADGGDAATHDDLADDAPPPDERWEREWEMHHYRMALQRVRATFPQRSVRIFERLMAGEPVDAVARSFATTTQAVHKVKQRIRNRVREIVDRQVQAEEGLGG